MQAWGAEDEAGRHQPQARGPGPVIELVRQHPATEQADGCRALHKERGIECGVGLIERKFVMQKAGQPTVEQPKPENKNRKHQAEQHKGAHSEEDWKRQRVAGRCGLRAGIFIHAAEEQKIRQCVENSHRTQDKKCTAPLAAIRHPTAEPTACNRARDLRSGQHGDGA